MNAFYRDTLQKLLDRGVLSREDKILVTCGLWEDRDVLQFLGFKNVVISNLFDAEEKHYTPFQWSNQDAENLTYGDGEFDIAIVHAGLHHCGSPHKGLVEMYRVARKGVIAFEPIDNLPVRLGGRLGLAQDFELGSVAAHEYKGGGWRNTIVPNYVHRWTRPEIVKTITSYAPFGRHEFIFVQTWVVDHVVNKLQDRGAIPGAIGWLLGLGVNLVLKPFFGRMGNMFAFAVLKPKFPQDLHPWLQLNGRDVVLSYDWFRDHKLPNPEGARQARFPLESGRKPETLNEHSSSTFN